ncbi:unnamed protein product, partial [Ilex paraguariensis]
AFEELLESMRLWWWNLVRVFQLALDFECCFSGNAKWRTERLLHIDYLLTASPLENQKENVVHFAERVSIC